ncbi:hypothetical protein ACFX13_024637 [Malus domestica]
MSRQSAVYCLNTSKSLDTVLLLASTSYNIRPYFRYWDSDAVRNRWISSRASSQVKRNNSPCAGSRA